MSANAAEADDLYAGVDCVAPLDAPPAVEGTSAAEAVVEDTYKAGGLGEPPEVGTTLPPRKAMSWENTADTQPNDIAGSETLLSGANMPTGSESLSVGADAGLTADFSADQVVSEGGQLQENLEEAQGEQQEEEPRQEQQQQEQQAALAPAAINDQNKKLFLGGLAWETQEDSLLGYFSKYAGAWEPVVGGLWRVRRGGGADTGVCLYVVVVDGGVDIGGGGRGGCFW